MTSNGFRVELEPDRERVIVRPIGEIDLSTADEVEEPVLELLDGGFSHVVVDLRGVTFLDSSGIRALVTAHRRASDLGSHLSVRLGGSGSTRALQITGVLGFLDVEPDAPGLRDGGRGWGGAEVSGEAG